MQRLIVEIKDKIIRSYTNLSEDFEQHPQKYFRRIGLLLVCSLLLTAAMFFLPSKIKEAQVDTLIYSSIDSEKLQPLPFSSAHQEITDSRAVSVMFSLPKGELYQQVIDIFEDPQQSSELNRTIFFYPLVYDTPELEQQYGINKDEITIVFFERGEERNRLVLSDENKEDLERTLIPALNRLPLINIKQLEKELANEEETAQSTDRTTLSTTE
ncbi:MULTISPECIES: hypothetical protein [unclassified Enterococcus]|uniref:hypothetical protein n=1 Tax=unclassified Enterococcus TaxID=2608891 RepID=UPI001A9BCB6B|nr:hypothetical protein [Enterococcus sp. DIV1271a]MBO1299397.1 hypothetical protein [Enterococcus sp. DIV1271a]